MKFIVSRYNQDIDWIKEYSDDVILYDRSEKPLEGAIVVPNIGSDIYDKLTFIIDNYENLPQIAVYTKANLWKYISKGEFDSLDKRAFCPLLTQHHGTHLPVSYYSGGMYHEINNFWYLHHHKAQKADELIDFLGIRNKDYLAFAPGSNYILPRENILKHSKEYYQKLRSYLEWDRYPGEAQIIERSLYYIWQ